MTKKRSHQNMNDTELRIILKKYDPTSPLAGYELNTFEADILEQINGLEERGDALISQNLWPFTGKDLPVWGPKLAACAAVFIMIFGFFAGQAFYGTEVMASQTDGVSLMVLSDEASEQYMPITDRRETNEDIE